MSLPQTEPLFSPAAKVSRPRLLRGVGRVLVHQGQMVEADTVIACTEDLDAPYMLDVATGLGVSPARANAYVRVRPGDMLAQGDVVAEIRRWGLWQRRLSTPVGGRVQSVRDGLILLRVPHSPEKLTAGMPGVVQSVHDGRGATIAATAAYLRGSWGGSGEGIGPLILAQEGPDGWLEASQVGPRQRGAILVARRVRDALAIRRAATCLVRGLVVGSLPAQLATLCETVALPTLVTEGFGSDAMADAIYQGLCEFQHKGAVLFGADASQGLWAELVIPLAQVPQQALAPYRQVSVGALVRLTAGPHRGSVGIISEVPDGSVRTALGDWVRGVYVRLGRGERVFAALSNIQVLIHDT